MTTYGKEEMEVMVDVLRSGDWTRYTAYDMVKNPVMQGSNAKKQRKKNFKKKMELHFLKEGKFGTSL
jgi:hypothetical protein